MNPFAGDLADHTMRYIQLHRALGYVFETQAATLRAFGHYVEDRADAGPLTQALVLRFVLGCHVTANVRARRYAVLRNFADYLAIFDPHTEALDPRVLPRSRAIAPVRILDSGELAALLRVAQELSRRRPMRGRTLYTVVGLLASTGLRSGEALRLDRSDIDLEGGILRIRETKFHKHRLVPVHPTTIHVLRGYAHARDAAYPRATSPAFFLSLRGGRLSAHGLETAFRQACAKAGLDQGLPRRPRPHDLRHRFAVTRLVTWHREGADVQARLPLLATYLGHARYTETAYYVTGTPELLGLAAARAFGRGREAS